MNDKEVEKESVDGEVVFVAFTFGCYAGGRISNRFGWIRFLYVLVDTLNGYLEMCINKEQSV